MKFKKVFSFAMCAVMALSLVACGSNKPTNSNDGENRLLSLPNPFTEYQTLEEAEQEAQFTLNIPQSIEGYSSSVYRLNKETGLLEVVFENGEESITFRKASGDGDISGDYNNFAEKNEVELNDTIVTMKGADGKVNVSVWSKDGYAYSINCTTAVEKITMTDFVKTVMSESAETQRQRSTSPFVPYDSMTEATKMAGFDMTVPNTPDSIEAWEGYMIQAFYGEDGADMLIRKATGSEDISGDYNEYPQVEDVNGVTFKGQNGLFSLAVWTSGDYSYSISVSKALSQADLLALIAQVK